ncbi:HupE/UreJ family protein [Erythrobacter sp. THAF29]|uniref:HupE/UreJ family protein n=1 Tax=Erythrobacter sp. THAF29 TaxID=2587851 RepID=UPI0012A7A8E5|nr:HupE/UreJ family protein [Erythrobacter sp. THAF29]QFT75956.1 HupE / UreJ protein [Erythrobacter sp. THAF29]
MKWLVALFCALLAAPLAADELRPAVIELTEREPGIWLLEWKLPVAATTRNIAPVFADPVLPESCKMLGEPSQRAAPLALLGSARLRCSGDLSNERFGLSELVGNADALARFVPLDRPAQTFRLTAAAPTATIAAEPETWAVARDYFVIGAEHILFGWDHLLFVIALVLLVRRGWAVAGAATAFTVAHSITLVATTLGYTGLPSRPVEALIALSIVFLAVEVTRMLRDPEHETFTRRAPWVVAFAFGLLHGFGFAGALADIGLPQGEIASALVAFNLGVEAGQLFVIAVLLALLAVIRRAVPLAETPVVRAATYGIGIIGSFWLFERVLG